MVGRNKKGRSEKIRDIGGKECFDVRNSRVNNTGDRWLDVIWG